MNAPAASLADPVTTLGAYWTDVIGQWLDQSRSTARLWSRSMDSQFAEWARWTPSVSPVPGRHHHGSACHHGGCHDPATECNRGCVRDLDRYCGHDCDRDCQGYHRGSCTEHECHCGSGVCDADVVLHARAGELRAVPFRLHNRWRRERAVSLSLGRWHVCGDLEVRARLEDEEITLKPCETRVVRLLVAVSGKRDDGAASAEARPESATDGGRDRERDPEPDAKDIDEWLDGEPRAPWRVRAVDGCGTACADIRFEGCARARRVAVVVTPGACDGVDVGCDCGCCC